MRKSAAATSRLGLFVLIVSAWVPAFVSADDPVDFNRDIRPLLSDNCFQCHGPDANQRKADLRLDNADGARTVLTARNPAESEIYRRITSADPDEVMPPPDSGRVLTATQKNSIRRWIEQGAEWRGHWAFEPPLRPKTPAVSNPAWPRNPMDAFILHRLEEEQLAPSEPADRITLLRRVTLDLTGLPPTPEEVDDFLQDDRPDAWERVIDRLLASPRYGERMAVRWLDGARYADTSGYQSDGERIMWRWRDWVIEAFNGNLPFDQFTVEQLAGDLLDNPTLDQQIASGFNRNHRGNSEGGIIPEEYAVEYVVDRVETTSTVWLGLTMGCGRCHEHKFDPITQREFYQLFAYFNNVPESGRAMKYRNSPPYISTPTRDQQRQLVTLEERLATATRVFDGLRPELTGAQAQWEREIDRNRLPLVPDPASQQVRSAPGDPAIADKAYYDSGKTDQGYHINGIHSVGVGFHDTGDFGFLDKFTLSAWIFPRRPEGGTILSKMTDVPHGDGYSLVLENGKLQVNLVKRWLDDALRVESVESLPADQWSHVLVTYDGSRVASGVAIYFNGQRQPLKVNLDLLNQTFATKEPVRIGGGNGPKGLFHGIIDDVRVFKDVLSPDEIAIVALPDSVAELLATPAGERSPAQTKKLRATFLAHAAPEAIRQADEQVRELTRQRQALIESFPNTMVMQELPEPRPTHILLRGEYNRPGERVTAGLPACLPPFPADQPNNRLGLARWLTDPRHPLTSRVAVNRVWQMLFGTGLVKTVDDFGAQGEWPSHPALLDWLAVEYAGDWDAKRLLRQLVTSATYRQSSKITPELLQRDPENRLLARGPRQRLSPEMVRDQALFAAGLLVEQPGGPSVKPYQPEGLWKELADADYVQDHGASLYRRSMYTFWKRTIPPPTMLTFDAAGRETCIVRETRTNTPLQALTLMNDVTFVEASRVLAQRVMHEAGPAPEARLALAFRLAASRHPRPQELALLTAGLRAQHENFRQHPDAADQLLSLGEWPRDPQLDPAELAALATMAGVMLNLDETITKE